MSYMDLLLEIENTAPKTKKRSKVAPEPPEPPKGQIQPLFPFRRINPWVSVPAAPTHSPGAAAICQMLQGFGTLVEAVHREKLPSSPLSFESPDGDLWEIDKPGFAVLEIESYWSERARQCARSGRNLTEAEERALELATAFLDGIAARWDGDRWLDLEAIEREQDAAFKALRR